MGGGRATRAEVPPVQEVQVQVQVLHGRQAAARSAAEQGRERNSERGRLQAAAVLERAGGEAALQFAEPAAGRVAPRLAKGARTG